MVMNQRALGVGHCYNLPFLAYNKEASIRFLVHHRISSKLAVDANGRSEILQICRSTVIGNREGEGTAFSELEIQLIDALIGIQGRGKSASPQQLLEVERAVESLEDSEGVPEPTKSALIEGRWQLMFTTRPGTSSPIQRTFTGVDSFSVFQEVFLQTSDPRVSNIVKFSDAIGELKVEAAASPASGNRILFQFDKAAFSLKFLPFKVPYPVPFRLLGDEAKGWLDTTYLSRTGNLRISKGSKGTTFVLQKNVDPRQRLLSVISSGARVPEAIEEFLSAKGAAEDEETELAEGEWQMIYSSQTLTESWIENAANGLMGKQIIRRNGQIVFMVNMLLGIRFSVAGTYKKCGKRKYDVRMRDAALIAGGFGIPAQMAANHISLELLYQDDRIRISRGYDDVVFVHLKAN